MTISTRQERKRLVLKLYNQGKTKRETARDARMSFRDTEVILNKAVKEKIEGLKEQQGNPEKTINNSLGKDKLCIIIMQDAILYHVAVVFFQVRPIL